MEVTTVKQALLVLALASALPLAACGHTDTPTSPTQAGPPVVAAPDPTPTPAPTPDPPAPVPVPTPIDDRPIVTMIGYVVNLDRSGAGDLDITFRIDDFTVVRASANTPVTTDGRAGRTDSVRAGQRASVEGRRTGEYLDATTITIIAQAP